MQTVRVKVVTNPAIARFLISEGYTIHDIKPNRERPRETVFIFRLEDGLIDAIKQYCDDKGYNPNKFE